MTRELRLAPHGASDAECAVCAHLTGNRLVDGDGHIPMCSEFCLQAWPRVRTLLADRDALRARVAELEGALRSIRIAHDENCDFLVDDDECDTTKCTCGCSKTVADIDTALADGKTWEP